MNPVVPILLLFTAAFQSASVRVEPSFGVAGNIGTWTVTYEVGASGMRPGGAVRVQLPDTWHAGERNSANRLQATDPKADHYVSARASRPDVKTYACGNVARFEVASSSRGRVRSG